VTQGEPGDLTGLSQSDALLLVYPPPRSPMASEALHNFRGKTVVMVGEWLGDTGTPSFAHSLVASYELQSRVPLIQWADTVAELQVWRRRSGEGFKRAASGGNARAPGQKGLRPGNLAAVLACDSCGAVNGKLRRCLVCRAAVFCSFACAQKQQGEHQFAHACRFVWHPPDGSGLVDFDYSYSGGWLTGDLD